MRRRLLLTYLSLLACVLVALEAPLAITFAARETQTMFIDRLNDAARFASLAEPAVRTGETVTLQGELERYAELYGIDVAVVDRDGRVVVASSPSVPVHDAALRRNVDVSLAGERAPITAVVWPWRSGPLVVSEPVGRIEVIGAVVSSSPTDRLRQRIAQQWAVIWLVGLAALLVCWLLAVGMTRWILRPVRQLDETARQITSGHLDARAAAAPGPVELRHLAASFNTMADTVIGALEQQRQFVDHASHQLRNPLAALRLRIENIQLEASRNPAGDFGAPEQIQLALEESDRLTAILDGLLALASAERGRFRPEPCEVGSLVDARLDALRPLAQRHGVTLVRSGREAQEALAIPGTVEQAVDELVGNACKFAGDGATVTVHLAERDGLAELHVVDDGPGLEEGELEQASTRFWRSRAHQNVDGSGLGLAILSVLAEASGGDVTLQRAHPTGLDVRLRLPLVADAAGKERSDAQRPDGDAHPRGRGGDADGSGGAPHGTPAGGRADGQTLVSR